MIKVFITEIGFNDKAGDKLTNAFNEWQKALEYEIEIKAIHSNSNKFGWMLVIHYMIIN